MKPDVLGPPYSARTLELPPDGEGDVIATLVRRVPDAPSRRAVLYVHGFVDYFFQRHLADAWAAEGYDFYALDLRKYGRSLLPHQTPNYCTDLREYQDELDAAAQIVRDEDGHDTLVVLGHSTGGLITSLWAHDRRGQGIVDALVLNSPWFDLNASWFSRVVLTRIIDVLGRLRPHVPVSSLAPHYGRSIHRGADGIWDYDLTWKPHEGFPILAGWVRAIRRGHAEVARGLSIDCPVLVCCSTHSGDPKRWTPSMYNADCVLDVEHIASRAPALGPDVTVERIPGGIHDLALSAEPARERYFDTVFTWMAAV
ncbi:alpha/beta hydrolase [Actinobacteria bacterium YIM 96077]|uniref:Alpha/beta hydrolase n=1 Tax=Phytoactinopolyspora halophila TaxID=1981511 RepID=A0A329QJM5_9ACTN|nr:alpha/beta hydrolase [Phytoactinopolyspora halophila]AYY14379.1 alpha/beta hydrolase [Actinobacteria bacterium YIM 96077]RAW11899.1 alpha/beta hydrolase [Phytoactinopolyspora halophila]